MLNRNKLHKPGISLLEVLVVLLALGIISSFVIPSFFTQKHNSSKKVFCAAFGKLIQESLVNAIMSNKIHQIFFDIDERKITVKIHEPGQATTEHQKFIATQNVITIPSSLEFRNFFINGIDDFSAGAHISTIFFYIMPDGTSQAIIINIEDIESISEHNKFAIVINPFYSQVKEYDIFQKP